MKAELIPEESFTLQVGCHQIEGMRLVSKWNGLIELRSAKNEVLIASAPAGSAFGDTFDTLFGDIFRTAAQTKDAGTVIVMGSPDLVARLRVAESASASRTPSPAPEPRPPRAP